MKKVLLVFLCMGAIAFNVSAGNPPDVAKTKTDKAELAKLCVDHSDLIYMANEQEVISVPSVEIGTIEFIYIGLKSLYMKPVNVCVNSPPAPGKGPNSFNGKLFATLNRKFLYMEFRWRQDKYS